MNNHPVLFFIVTINDFDRFRCARVECAMFSKPLRSATEERVEHNKRWREKRRLCEVSIIRAEPIVVEKTWHTERLAQRNNQKSMNSAFAPLGLSGTASSIRLFSISSINSEGVFTFWAPYMLLMIV